ncbi:MAG: copper amine oxidase N-terminal domain-containing protein [Paenibacillus sp.]|nr:copper amine oxidase N-terminal domain-containing protein [Paenibacillus sp.]
MKKLIARSKWFVPFIALLLILAGCQSIGGFDTTKALLGNVDVKSSESNMTFSLNAVPAAGISEENQEMIDLMNSISLNVSHVKLQDNGNISAQGSVVYKKMNLPFTVFLDKKVLVFTVDGAKQPFYYSIADYETLMGEEGLDTAKAEEVSKILTRFVVKNLPNPGVIKVTPVTEAVYGEQVSMTKLHAEVTGDEFPALLKSFLKSVSKDAEGLTELLNGLYDYLLPVIKSAGESADEFLGLGEIPLDNKEDVVTVLQDTVKLAVDAVLLVYDKQLNNLYESTPELKTVLSKDTKLSVDLFVDSGLHVRKQNVELNVALPANEDLPMKSISFKAQSETWNINGSVTADKMSTDGALDMASVQLTPGQIMRNFDANSNIYKIMKEDMGITKKTLVIAPEDDYYYPVIVGNTTMVPLRYVAQDLDAKVEWDGANRQIIVTDDLSGKNLIFKIGSNVAVIDGVKVKLETKVFVDEYGDAYVPLRILVESLQATLEKDSDGYIIIERE